MKIYVGEWNALLKESVSNVPFLQFDYLKTWWHHLGGGEWQQPVRLAIVTARENGKFDGDCTAVCRPARRRE